MVPFKCFYLIISFYYFTYIFFFFIISLHCSFYYLNHAIACTLKHHTTPIQNQLNIQIKSLAMTHHWRARQLEWYSVLSAPETSVLPTARPPPPEIPKSPPKWPLRPGVLVHVKCDTKQNLCASRIQSPNTSSSASASLNLTNVSYASPLINVSSRNASVTGSVVAATAPAAPTPTTIPKVPDLPARNSTPPIVVAVAPKSAAVKGTMSAEIATVRPTTCGSANRSTPSKTATVKRLQSASITNSKQIETNANSGGGCEGITIDNIGTSTINESTIDICQINGVGDGDNNDAETTLMVDAPPTIHNANAINNDELIHFTTSSLIERILGRLRWRREHTKNSNQNHSNTKKSMGIASLLHPYSFTSSTSTTASQPSASQTNASSSGDNEESIFSRSNKRAVNLLRATGWFGSGKSTNSSTGLMYDKRHHLSGITASDGGKYQILRIGFPV